MNRPKSDSAKIVLAVLGGLMALAVVVGGFYGIRWITADIRGEADARETIKADGDFRIAAYDRFFAMCSAIQGHEDQIESLQTELEDPDHPPTERRVSEIQASLTAVRSQRNDTINDYNADASRDWTVGQFRAEGLPHQLDKDAEETACSVG